MGFRIFALADIYDALTHDRPYRPAWAKSDAKKYLLEQSGQHFDPDCAKIFIDFI